MKTIASSLLLGLLIQAGCLSAATTPDEFKVKRKDVFEFTEKPVLRRDGDRVEVAFAVKDFCDATVCIENEQGRIVRHLASGVLGSNPPSQFQKNSLQQAVVWDGKDDEGKYLDQKDSLTVRVSLGLKPQFERTLFWSPHKRIGCHTPIIAAAPEGVYVYEGMVLDQVRLFDHQGNYLRTVYPFPGEQVEKLVGVTKHNFVQDGQTLPLKVGFNQATLLTAGTNGEIFPNISQHEYTCPGSNAFAVRNGRIALLDLKLNRLATDGSTGGLKLEGSKTSFPTYNNEVSTEGLRYVTPRSAAFSPDGKWLYQTGYYYPSYYHYDYKHWIYAVTRSEYASDAEPQLFAGAFGKEDEAGNGEKQLKFPSSVACDRHGRVYVSDYMNDRIQVFDESGKLLKSIPASKPAQVCVHQRNDEIYVFSWMLANKFVTDINFKVAPTVTRLGSFDNPKVLSSSPLPLVGHCAGVAYNMLAGCEFRMELDSWSDPPSIWLLPGIAFRENKGDDGGDSMFHGSILSTFEAWGPTTLKILVEKDGKLEVKRDFGKDVTESVGRMRPPVLWRQRLYVNPRSGKVYVGEGDVFKCAFMQLLEVDPENGKTKPVELPVSVEDMSFDPNPNGLVYLRTYREVARYDFDSWREVPFDYGEEREKMGFDTARRASRLISAIPIPDTGGSSFPHRGGMCVSLKGQVAVTTCNVQRKQKNRQIDNSLITDALKAKPYAPRLFAGRMSWGEIHVYDKHGKLVQDDAFAGMGHSDGIAMDALDNLYVMSTGRRLINGQGFDPELKDDLSHTLVKARMGKGKVLSPAATEAPLPASEKLARPLDLGANCAATPGDNWVEGAEWFYGGVGFSGKRPPAVAMGCGCWNARFALDNFARSFAPETRHFSLAVLDTNGNLILRIGKYGNVEDGKPLVLDGGPANPRSIGGDEVSLFHSCYVAAHTDRRLFIADSGNARLLSVKLGYHASAKLPLKEAPDAANK